MVQYTEQMLASWKDGQTRDVQADMMRLTLEIVASTLFAAEIGSDSVDASAAMETLLHYSMKRMGRLIPVPDWFPSPANLVAERAASRLDKIILIDHRRSPPQRRGSGRFAVDALARAGRGERPPDDRPAAPRRSHDALHGRT